MESKLWPMRLLSATADMRLVMPRSTLRAALPLAVQLAAMVVSSASE